MERKFRITKAKTPGAIAGYEGKIITMGEDGNIHRPNIGNRHDGLIFGYSGESFNYVKRHYEIEEITEPRIELKCVGFEEGDLFKFKGLEKVYKVENGVLLYDSIPGGWSQSIMDINGAEIKLIPQPTEEDKQIAELKETIEEAMRKIEEIEKARK